MGFVVLADEPINDRPRASGTGRRTGSSGPGTETPSDGLQLRWRPVGTEAFRAPGEQLVLGARATESGYLVFGYSAMPPSTYTAPDAELDYDAALWEGTPEVGWERINDDSFGGDGNQRITGVYLFPDGTGILAGSDETPADFDGAVWRSSGEGSGWERVADASMSSLLPNDQKIRDVLIDGHQLVAVGTTHPEKDDDAGVWVSRSHGRQWFFVTGGVASKPGDQTMAGVAKLGDRLVAVGQTESDGEKDAAAWWSNDGQIWHRVRDDPDLEGAGDQQINAITKAPNGFVAVGEETIDGDTDAVVWTSSDGEDWDRVEDRPGLFGGDGNERTYAVTASHLGMVAAGADVGVDPSGDEDSNAAIWTSTDGINWERLPQDSPDMASLTSIGDQEIKAIIPTEDGFLAFGSERDEDWDAQAWEGVPV